jgi:anti-sigma B factor antagonist
MPEASALTITGDTCDGVTVLRVEGEVDLATLDQFRAALLAAAEAGHLVVNLDKCEWLDSTGRGALVNAQRIASARGCAVALVCTSVKLLKIFRYTGLAGVFGIHGTDAEAAGAVRKS